MKMYTKKVGLVLLLVANFPCFAGISCSTLCTQKTEVRKIVILSASRKVHPANKSRSQLQVAHLTVVRQVTAADIHDPKLTQKQKEKRARVVRHAAEKQLKTIAEENKRNQKRLQMQVDEARRVTQKATIEAEKAMRRRDTQYTAERKKAKAKKLKENPSFGHQRTPASLHIGDLMAIDQTIEPVLKETSKLMISDVAQEHKETDIQVQDIE